ncbi:hypothetical protein BCR24_07715 [Enterococcus ureilyticus]|uniref:Uncharacterized protein n=1 Tax=Enterococcus ureilyticus TaxID=1131292 RepID=A0A1E5H940_9ENTE|nr:hypothetical protein [Enterococcus ureilyticus]MBM7687511.1 ABC-type multidrug transport system fused ATPase/permease subunit [Enterococcus ureilyticus]OEG21345.1 hypothetical protein BCR24_07715 [Enterococcus ureilyticus]
MVANSNDLKTGNKLKELDDEVRNQMRKHALLKTVAMMLLSFISLLFLIFVKVFQEDISGLIENISDFFIKGSLITIGISNIAGIISNFYIEKRLPSTGETSEASKKNNNKEYMELIFLLLFFISLSSLGIIYSISVISGMNNLILVVTSIIYFCNAFLIYKFNFFKEECSPEKYNSFENEMNTSKNSVKAGKEVSRDGDIKL